LESKTESEFCFRWESQKSEPKIGIPNLELEDNSKATFNINNHECNVNDDTEDNIGIIFKLEGNDVKVSLRNFESYVKFNKECFHKGYKCGRVDTYLSAQLFAAPALGQKRQKLTCVNKIGRFKKKE
jgi:hypothetical protein